MMHMPCVTTINLNSFISEQDRQFDLRQKADEERLAELEICFDTDPDRIISEVCEHNLTQQWAPEWAELLYEAGRSPGTVEARLAQLDKINDLASQIKGWCIETIMEKS